MPLYAYFGKRLETLAVIPKSSLWNHTLLNGLPFKAKTPYFFGKIPMTTSTSPDTQYIKIPNDKVPRKIAFKKTSGPRNTGVIYIPGFMSNMHGIKAVAMERFCQLYGFNYVRYDASGLGESKSIRLENARLTHWIEDAHEILRQVTQGPQIVVGSSMGGWITLYLAQKYPERFQGILLLAPGVNFVDRFADQFTKTLPDSILNKLKAGDVYYLPHKEYGTFPVSLDLAEDMKQYRLNLLAGIDVTCPVRIIHGLKDPDVPSEESLRIAESLKSSDVELTYVKSGGHRLSEDNNLELICNVILQLDATTSQRNT